MSFLFEKLEVYKAAVDYAEAISNLRQIGSPHLSFICRICQKGDKDEKNIRACLNCFFYCDCK